VFLHAYNLEFIAVDSKHPAHQIDLLIGRKIHSREKIEPHLVLAAKEIQWMQQQRR